jgi:hypothetical protein
MKHWVIVGVAAAAITTAATPAALAAPPKVTIEVLSSRADLVTGGDALVRITVPRAGDARRLKVKLGAKSVTRKFAKRSNGEVEGLLTGIGDGRQTLTAEVPKRYGARITLVGHPNGGPLISGPQLTPWVCQATAVDRQCNQAASYELKAVTGSGFVAYDPAAPPSGIKDTTTTDGRTATSTSSRRSMTPSSLGSRGHRRRAGTAASSSRTAVRAAPIAPRGPRRMS